jgi:hypothetical protein
MAARFWVTGGTGNWNSTTNWSATSGGASGASVPGSSDTAALNANSGSGAVTLDISPTIQTLTCTGFTGTLAFGTNTISLNSTGTIFTGATTMTVTGTPQIIATNSSATARTISPQVVTEANSISFRVTAGTGGLSLTAGGYRDLDFTDGSTSAGFGGAYGSSNITIYGDLKFSTSGMTLSDATGTFTFAATSGTKTITPNGVATPRPFTFNGVGGTWQLQGALTSGATRTATLTNGTLDLNGYTLTTGAFSSSNSNTRTLAFGSTGKIVATTNSGTVCVTSTATGLTVTGSKRVELNYSGSVGTRTISGALTATVIEGVNLLDYYITAGTDTIVVTSSRSYGDIDFSNGGTSTFAGSLSAVTNTTAIYGNLILNSAMSLGSGTDTVQMKATSGTKTITSAGKTLDFPLTFDGIGGTWSCTDALTLGSTRTLTLTNGTLTTNGYAITAGSLSSNNANVRALNLGASVVTISATGTPWNITDSTNMTLNAGTSSISTTGSAATMTFAGGGLTYYNVTLGATYYNTLLTGANTFNNFTVASPSGAGRRAVSVTANQTISGTLTCSGSAANSRPRLQGVAGGSTVTAAAVSLADADFSDITAAGASSPWSGTRLGNLDNNTNITFATPKTVYWNQPAGGNWSDVAWALTSGGTVGANNFPLPQDTAILDNAGAGASSTITMDYGFGFQLSAGSLTNALTIDWNCFANLSASSMGDFTLSSAFTITHTTGTLGFNSLSSLATVTTAGVTIPISTVTFNSLGNTLRLADNFTSTGVTNVGLAAGTLDLNGKTLTCVIFDSTFTDLEVRVLAFNGGQIDVTGNSATVWACEDLTNFSYTGTPTVNFTYSGSVGTRTINNGSTAGGTEANAVDFNIVAGGETVNFQSGVPVVRNLTFQPAYTGSSGLNAGGYIYGDVLLSPSQTVSASSVSTTFAATSGTKTITTNGVTIDRPLIFGGIGGTWSLQDALTVGATRTIAHYAGTLTTNGYAVVCGKFGNVGSSATGNRTLNLGASSFTCLGPSNSIVSWQLEYGSFSYTVNAGTSTIFMAEAFSGTSTQDFYGGGQTYYNLVYSGGESSTIYGSNTFNSISNSTQPLALSFEAGTTQTVNNFGFSGTSGNLVTMTSATPGTRWNLAKRTGGKVLVSFCSITDSAATPAGYWFAPTSQGNVDGGNNTGWNFASTGQNSGFMLLM